MTPEEVLALLQVIARQQQQIVGLEDALRQAQVQEAVVRAASERNAAQD